MRSLVAAAAAALAAASTTEYYLEMADGVMLHTLVDLPSDTGKFAAVIDRSPYGQDNIELMADIFTLVGHAAVRQDVRGTHLSNGTFGIWCV